MKYKCPKCKQGFDKADNKHCPHCKAALVSKRGYIDGKLTFWWEAPELIVKDYPEDKSSIIYANPEGDEVVNITNSPKDFVEIKLEGKRYPFRLTEPGQLPVVIQSGDNEFDVYFQHMMYTGMVYCPKCQSPAFQNMQLFGDLEHWCDQRDQGKSCKAKTTYHFNDPVDIEVNQSLTEIKI